MEDSEPVPPTVTARRPHQTRLAEFHKMYKDYYNPNVHHPLKAHVLPVDIQNPQFTFEYAAEFQKSMQREEQQYSNQ